MGFSTSAISKKQATATSVVRRPKQRASFSTGAVRRGSGGGRTENNSRSGGFSVGAVRLSPAEVFYPEAVEAKVNISPYASLEASPIRRIRGLAILNSQRANYEKVF